MKKTYLAVLLAAMLSMSLAGCGKNISEETSTPETTTAAAADTEPVGTAQTETASEETVQQTLTTTETTGPETTIASGTTSAAAGSTTTATTQATTRVASRGGSSSSRGSTSRTPTYTPSNDTQQQVTDAPEPEQQTEPTTLSPEETPIEPPAGWTWYVEDAAYDGEFFSVPVKADAGFELVEGEQGDAYGFETFLANLEKGNVAAAEMTQRSNRVAGQDSTIVTFYLLPPEDAQPGQTYTLTITRLSVGNYAGQNFNESYGIQLGSATLTIPEPETEPAAEPDLEQEPENA